LKVSKTAILKALRINKAARIIALSVKNKKYKDQTRRNLKVLKFHKNTKKF
jgi:hypothetical protein